MDVLGLAGRVLIKGSALITGVVLYTVEPLYKDAQLHRKVFKITPEMRTPPLIRTLQALPRVSVIERFHCGRWDLRQ